MLFSCKSLNRWPPVNSLGFRFHQMVLESDGKRVYIYIYTKSANGTKSRGVSPLA